MVLILIDFSIFGLYDLFIIVSPYDFKVKGNYEI